MVSIMTNRTLIFCTVFLFSVQATEMDKLLANNPLLFKPCESNLCFTFRSEKPIIYLDPQMRTAEQQKLFKCRERASVFPGLKGPFFDLVDDIPELQNASCIWAGPNETFDGLVRFVRNVSRGTRPLKFVTGGMLFQMAHRISNGTIPSASMSNGKLVVVSINRPAQKAIKEAIDSIVGPFGNGTWWLLSGFILLLLVVYVLTNYCFLASRSLPNMYNAMLEPFVPTHWLLQNSIDHVASGNKSKESRAYLIRVWKRSALLFLVISALFWEIGVVNFVTNDRPYVIRFTLRGMRIPKLKRFVVNRGSAYETLLRNLALHDELARNARPWQVVANFDEVFDALSETKDGEPRYTLSSEHTTLYELNERGLCTKLAVHDSSDRLPDYSTVWYYTSHIGLSTRTTLDIRISQLREEGRIQEFIENSTGKVTLTCGLSSYSISIFVLLVPLGLVLFPFFMFILSALLMRWVSQQRGRVIVEEKPSALNTTSEEDNEV